MFFKNKCPANQTVTNKNLGAWEKSIIAVLSLTAKGNLFKLKQT
jgi:hypothetical protein